MAGIVVEQETSIDTGAYSVKSVSGTNEGSFMAMAAPVSINSLGDFTPFKMNHENTYQLEIVDVNEQGRFDYGNRKGWIIGEGASWQDNVMHTERDMRRFKSELYTPFIAGALRVAHPQFKHHLDEIKTNGYLIDKRWAIPIKLTASIAPGYYGLSSKIEEALQDRYICFVDMKTKGIYVFHLSTVEVVPESFGSFQFMLYDVPPKGTKVSQLTRNKNADILERVVVTVVDFGGRTMDWMTWQAREIVDNRYGSETIGFNDAIDAIAKEVYANNGDYFSSAPSRYEIIKAMRTNKPQLIGVGGKKIEIAESITGHMNNFAQRAENVWRNRLGSGQGIQVLALGGGAAMDALPYIHQRLQHEKRRFISPRKDAYDMYMANAIGTYLFLLNGGKIKK